MISQMPVRFVLLGLLLAASLAFQPTVFAQNAEDDFVSAIKEGELDLVFRWRYEFVDQARVDATDPITSNANASTLLTRLAYETGKYKGFQFGINFDDSRPIIVDNFNDTRNGKTQYPVVADPKGTDLNTVYLAYSGLENANFVLGRQRIQRANQRFVGSVPWRQNEQTMDALTADIKIGDKTRLFYGYVDRVKRIFGPDDGSPAANFDGRTHLFDLEYDFMPWLKLFGYVYLMDLEGNGDSSASNRTIGIKGSGNWRLNETLTLNYAAEFANQSDYDDNPNSYTEGYYRLDAGSSGSNWGAAAGLEVLGGGGAAGESFQTPLATLHIFQGRADKFLNPLPNGVEDFFISGNYKFRGVNMKLTYHDFSANVGSSSYGNELDFTATMPFAKHYTAFAGIAYYSADEFATDTTKIWLMFTANF